LLLSGLLLSGLLLSGCLESEPAVVETFWKFWDSRNQDEPGVGAEALSSDHLLKAALAAFEANPGFVDDHCIQDRCEARLFGLSQPVSLRKSGVFNPRDYYALWAALEEHNFVQGKRVLDLGTGSGPLALIAAHFGAEQVVATDINPAAVKNARQNVERFGWSDRIEVRLVGLEDPSAYSVIREGERFDFILSNPPWDDEIPTNIEEYSEKDPGYQFVTSMIEGLPSVLNAGGELLLLYAEPRGLLMMSRLVEAKGLSAEIVLGDGPEDLARHRIRERHQDYGTVVPLVRIVLASESSIVSPSSPSQAKPRASPPTE
jgi:methylase of polypeptide subunit release factors